MPEIPGVPTLQPIPQPSMSPGQAARPGETIYRTGEETAQIAQVGSELSQRLINAQRQVDLKQGQIALEHYQNQIYDDLRKATTPEQVDETWEHYQGQWPTVIEPLGKDHIVARALGQYGQQQAVRMEDTVNARKASIITENDKAANDVLGRKHGDEAITAMVGGKNPVTIMNEYHFALQSSVVHGTMTQAQADDQYDKWLQAVKQGAIGAQMNSPDPAKRKQLIEQLKTGKGPLDLSGLGPEILNKSLTVAEERDRALTNLAKSQNENVVLNNMANTFSQPLYRDNPEMQEAAIRDGKFLQSIGAVATDPATGAQIPDRVMAESVLRPFINAAATDSNRVALEKANKERDEVYDLFSKGQITQGMALARQYEPDFAKAKTDHYPTIVNAARSWEAWERTEARGQRAEAREGRMEARQAWQDRSTNTAAQIFNQIAEGKVLDLNKDIWALTFVKEPQLTPHDASELERIYKQSDQDKQYKSALSYLANLPISKGGTAESNKELVQMVQEWKDAAKNLKPEQFMDAAEKIGDGHSSAGILQWIGKFFPGSAAKMPIVPVPSPQAPVKLPQGAIPGVLNGKHGYVLNGAFHAD